MISAFRHVRLVIRTFRETSGIDSKTFYLPFCIQLGGSALGDPRIDPRHVVHFDEIGVFIPEELGGCETPCFAGYGIEP